MTRIRAARVDDAEALADVHVRTWRAAYEGLVSQSHLDGLDAAARVPGWRQWIREVEPPAGIFVLDDGGVAGLLTLGRALDPAPPEWGQVYAIYLLPQWWGRGAGRELMDFALRRLAGSGFTRAVLWTLDTNVRARRFYEAGGWWADGESQVNESRGAPTTEIRYSRSLDDIDASAPGGLAAAAPGDQRGGESTEGEGEQAHLAG